MLSGGAGDLFFGVLNASCCALGFRMFYNRDILSKNLVSFSMCLGLPPCVCLLFVRQKDKRTANVCTCVTRHRCP